MTEFFRSYLSYILIIFSMFSFMEFFAWFMHKFVMHGFLWVLHEDHHRAHKSWWEKNDLFTLFFSLIAVCFFIFGQVKGDFFYTAIGIGTTMYGISYFLFHDVMFHRRIKGFRLKANTRYLKRIINAHAVHHQSFAQDQARAFGFLFASKKYDK